MTRKSYKSDLTAEEWSIIEPLIPQPKWGGHRRTVDMREVLLKMDLKFYLEDGWVSGLLVG